MIYTQSSYWRSLALTPAERERHMATGAMAVVEVAAEPVASSMDAALAELDRMAPLRRGDLKQAAIKHGVDPMALSHRRRKEKLKAFELECATPIKRELMLVCEVPVSGQKNSKISEPKRRQA
jgi:hypothetical protein